MNRREGHGEERCAAEIYAVIARSVATWQSSVSRFEWRSRWTKSKAFTGLRPARPFSRRKRTQNALRRARVVSAPASPIRCASWQPQAGAELTRPCVQTAAPIPCVCLRCSPRFTARCRTRPAHPCATCLLFRFIPQRQRTTGAARLTVLATGLPQCGRDGTRHALESEVHGSRAVPAAPEQAARNDRRPEPSLSLVLDHATRQRDHATLRPDSGAA